MSGKMIFVSGLSGAGKTTLMEHAIDVVPNLEYLQTTTTRSPRPGEDESRAYRFVSDEDYEKLRQQSALWDHSDFGGYKYGADVAEVRKQLVDGTNLICGVKPEAEAITKLLGLYGVVSAIIWIDTPPEIARERIASDSIRSAREEDVRAQELCTHVFESDSNLDGAKATFAALATDIIQKD